MFTDAELKRLGRGEGFVVISATDDPRSVLDPGGFVDCCGANAGG